MENLNPEQKSQLKTWAGQRDAMLGEVAVQTRERDRLTPIVKDLSESVSDLTKREIELKASIRIMEEVEEERGLLISRELVAKIQKKTVLDAEIAERERCIEKQKAQKEELKTDIKTLTDVHDRVFERASGLDVAVKQVMQSTTENLNLTRDMVGSVRTEVESISENLKNKNADTDSKQ